MNFGHALQSDHILAPLLAFPVHAELRSLAISGSLSHENRPFPFPFPLSWMPETSERQLDAALDAAAQSEGVISRLKTVEHLDIVVCFTIASVGKTEKWTVDESICVAWLAQSQRSF